MPDLRVNGERLWDSLMEIARFGATPKGGSCRLALSEEDRQGRDFFVAWCRDAGCDVTIDRMGNIFARRPGRDGDRAPVVAGSHLDTQPHGGKFDGVFGVLAGLEVIRTLNDHGIETSSPVEVAMWTNEEGVRFAPAMIASGVFAGAFDVDYALARADADGVTIEVALDRIGYAGDTPCGSRSFGAFFEAHIEQGPILEKEGKTIGVVTGAQGIRWCDITVAGQDAHAGPTPMKLRRDALVGVASMITAINRIGLAFPPNGVATVGQIEVSPNSRNTIPGEAHFTVDMRHPDAAELSRMNERLHTEIGDIGRDAGLVVGVEEIWYGPPVEFDDECVRAVREAAESLGYAHRDIVSGAGHDACYISRIAPTAMIFIPCRGGISHNEEESAEPDDLAAGCNVLLRAILARAELP